MAMGRVIIRWLVLIILAGGALYLLSQREQVRVDGRLVQLTDREIPTTERISLTVGESKIVIERQQSHWRLIAPYSCMANQAIVRRLLGAIEGIRVRDIIRPDELEARGLSKGSFGLDTPRMIITLAGDSEDDSATIRIGNKTPSADEVYIESSASPAIFTVEDTFLSVIPTNATSFRARSFLEGAKPFFTSLEVRQLQRPFLKLVESNGVWSFVQPTVRGTDVSMVEQLISASRRLVSERFIYPDESTPHSSILPQLTAYGLADEGSLTIEMSAVNRSQPYKLTIGSDDGKGCTYALYADDGSIVSITNSFIAELVGIVDEISARARYFSESPKTIKELKLSLPSGEDFVLSRNDAEKRWYFLVPDVGVADGEAVESLLTGLSALRPQQSARALDRQQLDPLVRFEVKGQGASQWIEVCKLKSEQDIGIIYYGKDSEIGYEVALTNLPEVVWQGCNQVRFADRQILSLSEQDIRTIVMRGADIGCVTTELPVADGVWTSSRGEVDLNKQKDWLRCLSTLRANRVLAIGENNVTPNMGFDQPWREIVVISTSTEVPRRTLQIGSQMLGGRVARILGRDVIYLLLDEVVSVLEKTPLRE